MTFILLQTQIVLLWSEPALLENRKPELVVQIGHTGPVGAIALSRNGKYLVTIGGGGVKLWDVSTGKEMRSFDESYGASSIALSPDGNFLVLGTGGGRARMLSLPSGKEARTFVSTDDGTDWGGTLVAISSNGKYLVTGNQMKGTVKLWDLFSGQLLRTFKHQKYVEDIDLSPDAKVLGIVDGYENIVSLCDIATGKEIRTFHGRTGERLNAAMLSLDISQDGKYLATGDMHSTGTIWDLRTGEKIREFKGPETFETNQVLVDKVAFSLDGKLLATSSSDHVVRVWDIASGALIKSFSGTNGQVKFTSDGTLISGCEDHTVKFWNLPEGERIKTVGGHTSEVVSIAISPNGKLIVTGNSDGTAKVWDFFTGKQLRVLRGHTDKVSSVAFSPDGKFVVTGGDEDNVAKLWNLTTGEEIRTYRGHKNQPTNGLKGVNGVKAVAISPDGNYLVTGARDGTAKIWNISTGQEIRTLTRNNWVNAVAISRDGKYLVTGDGSSIAKLWDFATGQEIRSINTAGNLIYSVAISPDGKYFATGHNNYTGCIWDLATGKEIRKFGGLGWVNALAFMPDSKRLVIGQDAVKIMDIATGQITQTFNGHRNGVAALAVSSDSKYIVSGGADGTTQIWNVETGGHLALVGSNNDDDWIMFNPDGYFDSSKNGGELVSIVNGSETFGIDQFAVKNNRPDIILKRIGLGSPELIEHFYNQYQKRLRRLGLKEEQLSGDLHAPTVKITGSNKNGRRLTLNFNMSDNRYKLKRYNIYANDVPVFGAYGKEISGNAASKTETIELIPGKNKIEVSCLNEAGAESFRALTYADVQEHFKGNLYYIGFGVSEYKDKTLNLKYGHKDAQDLAESFSNMKGSFNQIFVKTYVNQEATVENIRKAKELLKDARPEDTLVVFMAGHGVHDRDAESTYYFITHETDLTNLSKTAAPFDLIEDLMQGVPPRNKLLLLDTCESGEMDEGVQDQTLAMAQSRGLKARGTRDIKVRAKSERPRTYLFDRDRFIYNDLLRRSGAIVFSSSQGGELSYEKDELHNGLFTKGLINGLTNQAADKNHDGIVSTDELRDYVTAFVAQASDHLQNPTVDRDNIYQKFGFPLLR